MCQMTAVQQMHSFLGNAANVYIHKTFYIDNKQIVTNQSR